MACEVVESSVGDKSAISSLDSGCGSCCWSEVRRRWTEPAVGTLGSGLTASLMSDISSLGVQVYTHSHSMEGVYNMRAHLLVRCGVECSSSTTHGQPGSTLGQPGSTLADWGQPRSTLADWGKGTITHICTSFCDSFSLINCVIKYACVTM